MLKRLGLVIFVVISAVVGARLWRDGQTPRKPAPTVGWRVWQESPEARQLAAPVRLALQKAVLSYTARGIPDTAFTLTTPVATKGDALACPPFGHVAGGAVEIRVGDLNGDGVADLVDACLFGGELDGFGGSVGVYGDLGPSAAGPGAADAWVHLGSGPVERGGAVRVGAAAPGSAPAPAGGAMQPLYWSARERGARERCVAWGLKPRRANLRLVVEKKPVLWAFDAATRTLAPRPCVRLFCGRRLVKSYPAALGFDAVRDKEKRDDYRTPEGSFYLCEKKANSKFYRSLRLSYPNREDAARGLRSGLVNRATHDRIVRAVDRGNIPPQDTRLGGDIMLHGGGALRSNWTWGCVALENAEIEELFRFLPMGTAVEVRSANDTAK